MLVSNDKFSAFDNAMNFLLSVTHSTCQTVAATPGLLQRVATMLKDARSTNNLIHITGMGRSLRAGMAFGELIKNNGFEVSYPGKTLARPIQKGDVAIAFSGSGWTQTTLYHVEASILRGAKVISMVGHERSKLGRLSDEVIKIPGVKELPQERSYISKQLSGKRSPLAPMGTVSELSAMLVGIGLAVTIESEDTIEEDFTRVTNQIIQKARIAHNDLKQNRNALEGAIEVYYGLADNNLDQRPTSFFIGAGMSGLVAHLAAMRFQHLGVKVRQNYDYRFRNPGDVITILSGSGETQLVLDYLNLAKKSDMKVIGITIYPDSPLTKGSDYTIIIKGEEARRPSSFEQRVEDSTTFIPSFEFTAAVVLDSIIAQLAFDFEIDEDSMRKKHTNIE